jgi:hypothetical protein
MTTYTPTQPIARTRNDLIGGLRGHTDVPATAAAATLSPNETAWSLLYGAIIEGIGASPQTFQLLYPFASWNWPTTNVGFTSSAQYDFCATMPQWSAVGQYTSSGTTFDGAYQQFLNCIAATTTDPQLLQKIAAAKDNLTTATNQYQTDYLQAESTYNSAVTDNNPTFTAWLASPAGFSYQTQLSADQTNVNQLQAAYNTLVGEATTPNLAPAQTAMGNQAFYTKLIDAGSSNFPPVPGYSISTNAQNWVNQVQGGGGTGGSISFSNSQSVYDYSSTWAQGSTGASGWFWSVYANGSWQQASLFSSDSSLSCTISFTAWDTIQIQPLNWYSGTTALKNGPYAPGYSAFQQSGTTWMFGKGGVVPLLKTSMLVCYQPSIEITVSQSTYNQFQSQWSAAGGIQVGPFTLGGSAGGSTLDWSSSASGMTLRTNSTSTTPLIFGVNINVLP